MIRVSVVAANVTLRFGLREVINNLPDLFVISAANRIEDIQADQQDVLVVVPPVDLKILKTFRAVLYLTDEPLDIQALINWNFSTWGALSINAGEDELFIAIQALADGLWVSDPNLIQKWLKRDPLGQLAETDLINPALTVRETEVLQLAAQGLANKQIAIQLGISEHTIKFHLSSLYAKLGVSSRTEAVRAGVRAGFLVL